MLAADYRLQLASAAAAAARALVPAEDRIAASEAEVRLHLHDALTTDHKRDFRALACLPRSGLRSAVMMVLRIDYAGGVMVETVTGGEADADPTYLSVLSTAGT